MFVVVIDDGIERRWHGARIAKDAVIGALVEGFEDGGRRFEIHVGDPHRQDVLAGEFLPLLGVGVLALGRSGEVERHG